jgi:GntR family transcriptional regulator
MVPDMDDLGRPDVPRYIQLASLIRRRIDDGTYPPGGRIPSEVTFVQETGFARDTVRKAVNLLVEENRLYIVRGLGTFVGPRPDLCPSVWYRASARSASRPGDVREATGWLRLVTGCPAAR